MTGIIAAGDAHTAQAGAAMFKSGGNAVDAAVAAAFTAFVSETLVVNIGAGGFAMVVDGGRPENAVSYDFFSAMPTHGGDRDFRKVMLDFGGEKQPFFIGRASTAVPGALAGLRRMAEDRAILPLTKLMEPAIALAHKGFSLTPQKAYLLKLLEGIYRDTPQLDAVFAPTGRILREGEPLRLPQLGQTLQRISQEGTGVFYQGYLAEEIAEDHRKHGGLINTRDLETYRVRESSPIRISYGGRDVLLTPPSSHGGALLGFSLKLLETVNLEDLEPNGFDYLKIMAHVSRLTNIARAAWHEDDRSHDTRIKDLLAPDHVAQYSQMLQDALAGAPFERDIPTPQGSGHTTHVSTMDSQGLAVSMTFSSGECGGYLVGDTGMSLNNMLGEHDLNPHGFHQDPAGARLMSMMCPVTILENGRPVLTLGSAGSNRIRSAILQVICCRLNLGMPIQQAINQPRFHYEDGVLQLEGGVNPEVASQLEDSGLRVNLWTGQNLFFGGAQAVGLGPHGLEGGGDHRRGGETIQV